MFILKSWIYLLQQFLFRTHNCKLQHLLMSLAIFKFHLKITVDFGELNTSPTECNEKWFQMMSFAYLHYGKAPQNMLMLMIHLKKRSAR